MSSELERVVISTSDTLSDDASRDSVDLTALIDASSSSSSVAVSTSKSESNMNSNVAVNEYNVRIDLLSKLSSKSARKAVNINLSDLFKVALNAEKISAWVAYKLACCDSAEQSAFYALYIKQSERISTSDIDAVKRNANSNNTERVDFATLINNDDARNALKNNVARIVVRERRSTESYERVDANANAHASAQLDSIARSAAERLSETERVNALNLRIALEASRVAAEQSARANVAERVNAHNVALSLAAQRENVALQNALVSSAQRVSALASAAEQSTSTRKRS